MMLAHSQHYPLIREIMENVKKQQGFELDPWIDVLAVWVEKIYDYGVEVHIIPRYHVVEIILVKHEFSDGTKEYHAEIRRLINVECGGT